MPNYRQIVKDAPLDDLISGEYGWALSGVATDLVSALSAMPTEQVITACHHSNRLSDEVRETARNLADMIIEQADIMAAFRADDDREDAAYAQADWERNCAKEADLY